MTIQEINDLIIDGTIQDILEGRLILANLSLETPIEDYTPTQIEVDAEFIIYKDELIIIETERLRVQNLQDRIDALKDSNYVHAILNPNIPNAALHIKNTILNNQDHTQAEASLVELEAKDAELKAAQDAVAYIDARKKAYPAIEELIVAMWEGDQVEIDRLEAIRQQVKLDIPKT